MTLDEQIIRYESEFFRGLKIKATLSTYQKTEFIIVISVNQKNNDYSKMLSLYFT